jgi:hypothetical protein
MLPNYWQGINKGLRRAMEKTKNKQLPLETEKKPPQPTADKSEEIGGVKGPEPTRYGDWEHKGRVSDF